MPVSDRLPIAPAVSAGHQAADLDGSVHVRRVGVVGTDSDNPFANLRGFHRDVREFYAGCVHRLPAISPVIGTLNGALVVAGVYYVGVLGMGRQGPDLSLAGRQSLPMFAPVIAAVHALMGPGEYYCRVLRVDHQSPYLGTVWQPTGNIDPFLLAIFPAV